MQNETPRNCWLNEKGQCIAVLPEEYLGNIFLCSKCLNMYDNLAEAKIHTKSCLPKFQEIIFQKETLSIAHVTCKSTVTEKRISERISKISYYTCKWDAPALRNNKWATPRIDSQAFLLLCNASIISYLSVHTKLVNCEGASRFIADLYTADSFRRKGYMKLLVQKALVHLGESLSTIEFTEPYTPSGLEFIHNMEISRLDENQ